MSSLVKVIVTGSALGDLRVYGLAPGLAIGCLLGIASMYAVIGIARAKLDFDYTIFGHVMPRSLSAIDKIMEGERIRNIKFQYPTGRK